MIGLGTFYNALGVVFGGLLDCSSVNVYQKIFMRPF